MEAETDTEKVIFMQDKFTASTLTFTPNPNCFILSLVSSLKLCSLK
jgi:hypothetical protein